MKSKSLITKTAENAQAIEQEREQIHKTAFSNFAHDLKTPLACIIGSLEIHERMKDKLNSDQNKALIATALQEAYRLDKFITALLDKAEESNVEGSE